MAPGRGYESRIMDPGELIAANPLAGYPDGYSASEFGLGRSARGRADSRPDAARALTSIVAAGSVHGSYRYSTIGEILWEEAFDGFLDDLRRRIDDKLESAEFGATRPITRRWPARKRARATLFATRHATKRKRLEAHTEELRKVLQIMGVGKLGKYDAWWSQAAPENLLAEYEKCWKSTRRLMFAIISNCIKHSREVTEADLDAARDSGNAGAVKAAEALRDEVERDMQDRAQEARRVAGKVPPEGEERPREPHKDGMDPSSTGGVR